MPANRPPLPAPTHLVSVDGPCGHTQAAALRLRLTDALDGHGRVVVDLTAAEHVDLSILGVLLASSRRARAVGSLLAIVVGPDADPLLTHLVERSGLHRPMVVEPTLP